jgi:ribosomal protein L21E
MNQDFSIGDRVQISELGASRCPRLAGRAGVIVGRSIYRHSVSVQFDGNKTKSTFHQDYLQRIVVRPEPVNASRYDMATENEA